jgi:hypothetical protein
MASSQPDTPDRPASPGEPRQALGLVDQLSQQLNELRQWEQENEQALTQWQQRAAEAEAERDRLAQRLEDAEKARRELEQRRAELDQRQQQLDERERAHGELDARRNELAQREQALEDQTQALAQEKKSLDQQHRDLDEKRYRIGQRTQQLKQADKVMRRRRDKLRRYLTILRQQSKQLKETEPTQPAQGSEQLAPVSAPPSHTAGLDGSSKQSEPAEPTANAIPNQLQTQRQELAEIKRVLEASEQRMIRKWASYRAGTLVTGIIIAATLLTAVSWLAAGRLNPPIYEAALRVKPLAGQALPDSAKPATVRSHLLSTAVLRDALSRLARDGVRNFAGPTALAKHVRPRLEVDRREGGLLLRYTTPRRELAAPLLEALGHSYLNQHRRQAAIAGQSPSIRISDPASVRQPMGSGQAKTAGMIFLGLLALTVALGVALRVLLSRTPGVLEEQSPELQVLDQPSTWSPLRSD